MKLKAMILMTVLSLASIVPASAQTVTFHLAWSQTDATPAQITAGTYQYTLKIDSGTTATILPNCTAAVAPATGSNCIFPLTALTSGTHTLLLTAFNGFGSTVADPLNGSAPSKPVGVTLSVVISFP